ncbi:thermonuclease family protein [Pseudonocardia acaciae]|uniref:thermonuclease family protein n=1 Tax=Pseudonocardia acaciae TaxID=551276 RepID=UPI00048DF653|nr:thermonuclease family protein [Pseudonocardia acaciae]
MSFTLISGQYRIVGAAPDGDSVRFYSAAKNAFRRAGLNVRTNQGGGAQLRLDGIDALETHYTPQAGGTGPLRQPAEFGDAAAARLLGALGFDKVRRNDHQTVLSASPKATPGHILTRFADKYGRCVSFAFAGEPPLGEKDLTSVNLTAERVTTSANVAVLADGLAYPTYYSKLFPDLRQALSTAVESARAAGSGLWPSDRTTAGFTVAGLDTLTDQVVIMPKLFRRLVDYLALNDGDSSLAGLPEFLESQQDRLVVLPEGRFTGFDNVIEVDGQDVRLLYPPEDLVFVEK